MSQGDSYALLSGFFWSISVVLMRVSGHSIPPIPLTFFKSTVAIICFAVASPLLGEPLIPELSANEYFRLCASAVLGITIADTLIAAALNRLGASMQALADCIYAPAMAVIGFLMFQEQLSTWEILGGTLVVSGVVIGMGLSAEVTSRRQLYTGVLLAASAHVIMAVGILMVRDIYSEISVVWVSGFRFLVATLALGGFASFRFREQKLLLGFQRRDTWKTMLPMAILGPFLATIFWVAGFKYSTAGRAAIFNQLSTVFIIVLAYFFLKEKLSKRKWIGVGLALLGAIIVAAQSRG
jgi:drug/metabolite transporter (DMT)-like permease